MKLLKDLHTFKLLIILDLHALLTAASPNPYKNLNNKDNTKNIILKDNYDKFLITHQKYVQSIQIQLKPKCCINSL